MSSHYGDDEDVGMELVWERILVMVDNEYKIVEGGCKVVIYL